MSGFQRSFSQPDEDDSDVDKQIRRESRYSLGVLQMQSQGGSATSGRGYGNSDERRDSAKSNHRFGFPEDRRKSNEGTSFSPDYVDERRTSALSNRDIDNVDERRESALSNRGTDNMDERRESMRSNGDHDSESDAVEHQRQGSFTSDDEEAKKDFEERHKRGEQEEAWKSATMVEQEQLIIWRLEASKVQPVDPQQYGVFFDDVIYVVLKAANKQRRICYDLHYWVPYKMAKLLRSEPPAKVMELAAVLQDNVIYHKEVEFFESSILKKYFKTFIVFQGSPKNGFDDKEPMKYKPRLLRFKLNHRRGELREVKPSKKALQSRGVFVIDKGLCAMQWNGKLCSERERTGAGPHIENLLLRRKGKLTREFYDEEDLLANNPFTSLLNDEDVEPMPSLPKDFQKSMLRLSNEDGTLKLTPIYHGRLARRGIEPSDVNFMDTADGLYIYIGPTANKEERNSVWREADKYLETTVSPIRSIHCIKAGQRCYEMDEIWDDYN